MKTYDVGELAEHLHEIVRLVQEKKEIIEPRFRFSIMNFDDQERQSEQPRPCHAERSEESLPIEPQILRCAQHDMRRGRFPILPGKIHHWHHIDQSLHM